MDWDKTELNLNGWLKQLLRWKGIVNEGNHMSGLVCPSPGDTDNMARSDPTPAPDLKLGASVP